MDAFLSVRYNSKNKNKKSLLTTTKMVSCVKEGTTKSYKNRYHYDQDVIRLK